MMDHLFDLGENTWPNKFKIDVKGTKSWHELKAQYERTSYWRDKREAVRRRANGKCESCKKPVENDSQLDVHHLTYDRIGNENLEDLLALCYECHRNADMERGDRTQERREISRFEARVNAYAEKKWGDLWEEEGHYYQEAEKVFIQAMYKKWCAMKNRRYDGDHLEIDEWFIEELKEGTELEDIEPPVQDYWY